VISARSVSSLLMLAALGAMALLVAVTVGSVSMTLSEFWLAIGGGGDPLFRELVFSLRLPRALAAFATGGLLALAGALMQVLLRNPLADPYVLGISGGAAVGALASMLLGLGTAMVSGSAFAGALLSTLLVFGLAQGRGSWTPTRLLLTGVVIAAGWGAVITFMLSLSPADRLPGMLYWLMGDLSYARTPWLAWMVLIPVLIVTLPLGRSLNVLARGPLQAAALGVAVKPRLVLGNDQRIILPASVMAGGALLTIADTLARTLMAPEQLPVGVITALLGVPTFLFLLYRSR
jgi:iron complex transport system permease protein